VQELSLIFEILQKEWNTDDTAFGHGLAIADWGLQIADCRLRIA